jgi:rRNA-processing protein FCF1
MEVAQDISSLKIPDVFLLQQAIQVSASIAATDKELSKTVRQKGISVFHPLWAY